MVTFKYHNNKTLMRSDVDNPEEYCEFQSYFTESLKISDATQPTCFYTGYSFSQCNANILCCETSTYNQL